MCKFVCEVDDENNGVSLGYVAHQIRAKVEIVGVVCVSGVCIQVGFVPVTVVFDHGSSYWTWSSNRITLVVWATIR